MRCPSLSKRWFKTVRRVAGRLATVVAAAAALPVIPGRFQAIIHVVPGLALGVFPIAAVGRGGVEEVYGVPYLDVGCDVCFHVAEFTTSPHCSPRFAADSSNPP